MKHFSSACLLVCLAFCLSAQKKAVTENGEEVLLFDDGTWKYAHENDGDSISVIPVNPGLFAKGKDATFQLKSNKTGFSFWLNPQKWTFKKAVNNPAAEYELKYKNGDVYGMIIPEQIEIPLGSLVDLAFNNARNVSSDLKVVQKEYRMVNGYKAIFMQMDGTVQGIKLSYYGYYYSSPKGTVQFITYTSQNLMEQFKSACEDLLNGMEETK